MVMARKLEQKGMPVIVSAWRVPSWAILGGAGGRGAALRFSRRGNTVEFATRRVVDYAVAALEAQR